MDAVVIVSEIYKMLAIDDGGLANSRIMEVRPHPALWGANGKGKTMSGTRSRTQRPARNGMGAESTPVSGRSTVRQPTRGAYGGARGR